MADLSNPLTASLSRFALTGLACLISTSSFALNLSETLDLALSNDASWSAQQYKHQAEKEPLKQARALLLPNLSLGAEVSKTETTQQQEYQATTYSANLRQPLFNLGSWYGYKTVKADHQRTTLMHQQERQAFLLRVLQTYLNVLSAEESLAVRAAELKATDRQKKSVEQRFKVGLIAKPQLYEATAAYDQVKVRHINAQRDLTLAQRNLSTLIGRSAASLAPLSNDLPIANPEPNDEQTWIDKALHHNKTLQAAQLQEKAAKNTYKARRSQHLPTVDLVASYRHNEQEDLFNQPATPDVESDTKYIALQLNLPLYTGGAQASVSRQAQQNWYAAQANRRATEQQINNETGNLVAQLRAHVASVNAQQNSILSAETALEATQAGYKEGLRTLTDVLNAQRNLYQAKQSYSQARFNYLLDGMRLKSITGTLNDAAVHELNQWLK